MCRLPKQTLARPSRPRGGSAAGCELAVQVFGRAAGLVHVSRKPTSKQARSGCCASTLQSLLAWERLCEPVLVLGGATVPCVPESSGAAIAASGCLTMS